MFMMYLMSLIIMILIFFIVNFYLIENFLIYKSNYFVFECGFDSIYWNYSKISLHFFKIGIVFIFFDLEIMFLIILFNNLMNFLFWFIIFFIFMTLLVEIFMMNFSWSK